MGTTWDEIASVAASMFPHHDGYPYVLVDLDRGDATELRELLTDTWLLAAPARVRQARETRP